LAFLWFSRSLDLPICATEKVAFDPDVFSREITMLTWWKHRWQEFSRFSASLGFSSALLFYFHSLRCRFFSVARPFTLTSKRVEFPLKCRPKTSDLDIFRQIFVELEFSCLDDLTDVQLVIDCGANVGYSAAYFLTRFPCCRVIAVEPDPGNFAMLEQNVAPYKARVRTLQTAVWSRPANLVLSETKYRSGRSSTRQVRECRPGDSPGMVAVDIGSLVRDAGLKRVSLLKVDIEGAEAVVFAENYESWINMVDNIAIELHDDTEFGEASSVFFDAISTRPFVVSRSGELTVCRSSQN
jgi:FkbM family methyltransferase